MVVTAIYHLPLLSAWRVIDIYLYYPYGARLPLPFTFTIRMAYEPAAARLPFAFIICMMDNKGNW